MPLKIIKIAKIIRPKKSTGHCRIAKKINIRHKMILKVGKRLMNLIKLQLNHNKTENTTSHQTTRTRIRTLKN